MSLGSLWDCDLPKAVGGASIAAAYAGYAKNPDRPLTLSSWLSLVEFIEAILFHDRVFVHGRISSGLNEAIKRLNEHLDEDVVQNILPPPGHPYPQLDAGCRALAKRVFDLDLNYAQLCSRPRVTRLTEDMNQELREHYRTVFCNVGSSRLLRDRGRSMADYFKRRYWDLHDTDEGEWSCILHQLRGIGYIEMARLSGATALLGGSRVPFRHTLVAIGEPLPVALASSIHRWLNALTGQVSLTHQSLPTSTLLPFVVGIVLVDPDGPLEKRVKHYRRELAAFRKQAHDLQTRMDEGESAAVRQAAYNQYSQALAGHRQKLVDDLEGRGFSGIVSRLAKVKTEFSLATDGKLTLKLGSALLQEVSAQVKLRIIDEAEILHRLLSEWLDFPHPEDALARHWPLKELGDDAPQRGCVDQVEDRVRFRNAGVSEA